MCGVDNGVRNRKAVSEIQIHKTRCGLEEYVCVRMLAYKRCVFHMEHIIHFVLTRYNVGLLCHVVREPQMSLPYVHSTMLY